MVKKIHKKLKRRVTCFLQSKELLYHYHKLTKKRLFGHFKNVLLTMVNDEAKIIQELGLKRMFCFQKFYDESVTEIRIVKITNKI